MLAIVPVGRVSDRLRLDLETPVEVICFPLFAIHKHLVCAAALETCHLIRLSAHFIVRLALAALFLFAGAVHLVHPALFLPVMPPWVPFHLLCIKINGVFELLGGMGLLIPERRVQVMTGWGLMLLLVAIFPANIYMALAHIKVYGFPSQPWIGWARLPLQALLILAVAWVTRIWPGKETCQMPRI